MLRTTWLVGFVWTILLADGATVQAQSDSQTPQWIPKSVELVADVPYAATDNPRQTLDLIVPRAEVGKPLPVVVVVHGGAWRHGDKRPTLRRVVRLATSGKYAAASIGYRLTDEAQWPAQIHDCKAAIRWIRANAAKYNLDPDRIGVWGSSAGGHLVAVLGTSGDVDDMDGSLGTHTDQSSRVACVVDFYGPTDFLQMQPTAVEGAVLNHNAMRSPESLLIGGPIQENHGKVATANPITYITADDPPFLIVHGTADPLVPFNQSELLHDALENVDVESTLVTVDGGGHGQGFPREVNEQVQRFFDHHLRGEESEWHDSTVGASTGAQR